jgi:hypothetical protein
VHTCQVRLDDSKLAAIVPTFRAVRAVLVRSRTMAATVSVVGGYLPRVCTSRILANVKHLRREVSLACGVLEGPLHTPSLHIASPSFRPVQGVLFVLAVLVARNLEHALVVECIWSIRRCECRKPVRIAVFWG